MGSIFFEEYHQYSENLLNAQYLVSDIIKHPLVKGEVCEDFLIDILENSFTTKIKFEKGVLAVDGVKYHNQMDIMLCREHCQIARIGKQIAIEPQDVKLIIEVKGNATGNDIKKFNELAGKIKALTLTHFPIMGMFCYKVKLEKKELLKRFGHVFDKDLVTYIDDSSNLTLEYPYLDYIICIDDSEDQLTGNAYQVFLQKNNNTGRYLLSTTYPTIKNLFDLVKQTLLSP
jgi:hypothetical protein